MQNIAIWNFHLYRALLTSAVLSNLNNNLSHEVCLFCLLATWQQEGYIQAKRQGSRKMLLQSYPTATHEICWVKLLWKDAEAQSCPSYESIREVPFQQSTYKLQKKIVYTLLTEHWSL
jgi:hypothetical protein